MLNIDNHLVEELIQKRRTLHRFPEVAFEEVETTSRLRSWLEEYEVTILPFDLETGLVAELKGENEGPTIAIRTDIDALPITEEADVPFKSEVDGKMHACGHDFHAASILGAAVLLNQHKDKLHGTVRFLFQPAEEIADGAKWMAERGVMEGVSAIFGMHNKPELPVGTIGVKSGPLMASVDRFKITFKGVGGHAGIPHHAIDPIVIASQFVQSIQSILSRGIDLFHNAVISVTSIHGGSTWNVIPDCVTVEGTVRTFQAESRQKIKEDMHQRARLTAQMHGGEADISWDEKMPTVHNSEQFEPLIRKTIGEIGYEAVDAEPVAGGEDFAYYQQYAPSFFVWMGTNGTKQWHHPEFTLDEKAIRVASEFFANLAVNVLAEQSDS